MSSVLNATLPAEGHRNRVNVVRNGEWPVAVTNALLRLPPTYRAGDTVRGKKTKYDLRTIFVQGGGCGFAAGSDPAAERQGYLDAFKGAKGVVVSGGTRMVDDAGASKAMVTELGIALRDAEGAENVQVHGSLPIQYDDLGLIRIQRGDAVGTGLEVDSYGSFLHPEYDASVLVQNSPNQVFGDYSGDLAARYAWLTQLGRSECYQLQFYYQNGGGITLVEIVESIKLVMGGAFPAGATVVLIEGSGRKTDEVCAKLADPASRTAFCAEKFGGKEPTVVRYGADVTAETVAQDVATFGLAPNVVIVPLAGLRAVNLGLGFIRG